MQIELCNTVTWATTIDLAVAMARYTDSFCNVDRRHRCHDNICPAEFDTLWMSTYSAPQLA